MRRTILVLVIVVLGVGLMASIAVAQEGQVSPVGPVSVGGAEVQTSPPPAVASAGAAQETLPSTGFNSFTWLAAAGGLLLFGGGALAMSRRSKADS